MGFTHKVVLGGYSLVENLKKICKIVEQTNSFLHRIY